MIGCTSDMFQCYQVRVQYIDQDYKNNTAIDEFHESTWKNLSRYDNLENEVCSSTKNLDILENLEKMLDRYIQTHRP